MLTDANKKGDFNTIGSTIITFYSGNFCVQIIIAANMRFSAIYGNDLYHAE